MLKKPRAAQAAYPKPGEVGGRLIRQVIKHLRDGQVSLPIASHILIATSGGSDSVALAHLLVKYGRRVAGVGRIELLHVNHGWRGVHSDGDEKFVEALATSWEVPVSIHRLSPPAMKKSNPDSLEEVARLQRKEIFQKEAERKGAIVLTAHQADDVAETLLWRLFTGAAKTHGGGIAVRHGVELRPLIQARKADLQAYLKEEGQSWREDSTNFEGRFQRSRMRLDLMPVVERLFPRGVEHLVALGLAAQTQASAAKELEPKQDELNSLSALFEASGLKVRRPHWEAVTKQLRRQMPGVIHLPGGWELVYEPKSRPRRWILQAGK
jgi:tRNA(Ile)-lysidine synthetase-like protein